MMLQKFLDAVRSDPKAQELISAMTTPGSDGEAAEAYVKIAKVLGFDLTADEILAGLKDLEQKQKEQSDKISLDDHDLENVAGGANPECDDTHVPGEWCWFTDSCSYIISLYASPPPVNKCKMSEIEDGFDNRFSDFSDSDDGGSSSSSSDSSYSFYQTESNICESGYDAFYPE